MRSATAAAAALLLTSLALCTLTAVNAALPEQCGATPSRRERTLKLSPETVTWGYYYKYRKPQMYVADGETFVMEMASHHAGDYYDGMIKGDPALEAIYKWTATEQTVPTRGANGRADGKHIMTGPVYICGAEVGDTVEIQILDIYPRKNAQGKAYGSNGLASWGWQYRTGYTTSIVRDAAIIYEVVMDKKGYAMFLEPHFSFTWKDANGTALVEAPCPPMNGTVPSLLPGYSYNWTNPSYSFSGYAYNCTNGTVTFGGYHYAGVVVNHPIGTEDYSIARKWRIPANPHIGNIGLTPDVEYTVNSAPPMRTAGNIDHRRLGRGARLFVNVEVEGGLLMAGDTHAAQGNSEYDGTATETSITAKLRVIIHKKATVPPLYANLPTPLLENINEWCWHGFTFNDYLHAPQLQPRPPAVIGSWTANSTYQLMNNTAVVARNGLMTLGFTEDQANSILTLACDWEVTQVVNSNIGQHICCPKYVKYGNRVPYIPRTFPGSSRPMRAKITKGVYW